jgi:hypothetical protein
MERLTIPDVLVDEHTTRRTMIDGEAVREHAMDFYWRLKAYEDTHMMPSDVTSMRMDMAIIAALFNGVDVDRMKELAEADKDGRLVVLPCKTVFELTWDAGPDCDLVCPVSIDGHGCCDFCDKGELCIYERKCLQEHIEQIGKTVFLTREEAEAALEGMKDA